MLLLTAISPVDLLIVGAPLNCLAGLLSFWRRSVNAGGAVAGAALGTIVFVAAGPLLWVILAAFVLSSTAFTKFRAEEKEWLASIQEKGGRRDFLQVLANGGVGLLMAILLRFTREPSWSIAFAAAFASANADTWASEIGVLSPEKPFSLPTLRPVLRGVSGGVTLIGLGASVAGSLVVGVVFALENALVLRSLDGFASLLCLVTLAGLFGSLVDSILGSTLQAQYAGSDRARTERKVSGGSANALIRGLAFVTNDVVNVASTAVAAAAGLAFSLLVR
jgi:uncharacterized protein (TIGR00297 family)